MFYYFYDWTYILVLIGVLICLAASARVRQVFAKYSRVQSRMRMTGKEAAEEILRRILPIIIIPEIKRWGFLIQSISLRPLQLWEWQPMSAAMQCSMPLGMRLCRSAALLCLWRILVPRWHGRSY